MTPKQIVHRLQDQGSLILRGAAALRSLREAIALASRQLDLSLIFDPASDPQLVDYLGIVAVEVTGEALDMALVGLLVGSLFGRAALGVAIGAGIGAGMGLVRGLDRVSAGWRIVAVRDRRGIPLLTVSSEA